MCWNILPLRLPAVMRVGLCLLDHLVYTNLITLQSYGAIVSSLTNILGKTVEVARKNFSLGFVRIKLVLHHCSHPHESVYIFVPVHPVPIFLCHPFLTMRSMSLFVCDFFPHFLSSVFLLPPLSVTVMLSQTYDDIDLENEPWYKFFSELEFGRPVSQGHSCSHNHNPVTGIHPLSPPHPWFFFFFMSPPVEWVGLVI